MISLGILLYVKRRKVRKQEPFPTIRQKTRTSFHNTAENKEQFSQNGRKSGSNLVVDRGRPLGYTLPRWCSQMYTYTRIIHSDVCIYMLKDPAARPLNLFRSIHWDFKRHDPSWKLKLYQRTSPPFTRVLYILSWETLMNAKAWFEYLIPVVDRLDLGGQGSCHPGIRPWYILSVLDLHSSLKSKIESKYRVS